MLPKVFSSTICFLILYFFNSASAQNEFGSIQGRVEDIEGLPIPGATVTASSPSWIGGAVAYTDREGQYRFSALSPGTYEVEADLTGFQTVIRKSIRLFLGNTATIDFTLQPETVAESITVLERPPLIDIATTATSNNVPPEIVQNLPKPAIMYGGIKQLLSLTPGVGDDLVAYGGYGESANRIWVDGVDVSGPVRGELYADYNYSWIEEVQVTGIGAPAEYGGFTGVVGNFITRSGSNQYHGLFETFFQNERFVSTNDLNPDPQFAFQSYDVAVQIGGPISRDKLWFFSGFQYPYLQDAPFGYDGKTTEQYPKMITKLTYKPDQSNTIQGFGTYNYYRFDGSGAGALVDPEATSIDRCSETSWNATWISLWTDKTTFEGRFGGFWADCKSLPRNGDTPGHFEGSTGRSSVNAFFHSESVRFRPQLNVSLTHFANDFLGTHDFKFGVQIERSKSDFQTGFNGGIYYYDYYGPYLRYISEDTQASRSNQRVSSYAQDNWSLSERLTLSLGIRWDHNRGKSMNRGSVYKTDPIAPRLGAIWNVRGNGKTVLKAHYGDYYEAMLIAQYGFLLTFTEDITEEYNAETGEWIEIDRFLYRAEADPDFKQPLVRQFTFGIDQELAGGIAVGAHYIHRTWENVIESSDPSSVYEPVTRINPITNEPITVYNRVRQGTEPILVANQPDLFRKYDGVELILNRRFADKLSLSASVVYSRIHGNATNFSTGVGHRQFPNPNDTVNFEGRLENDPTFAWKVVAAYTLPFDVNVGGFFRHASGDTWAPRIQILGLDQGPFRVFGLPRGTHRLPSTNILDVRLEKMFAISSGQLRIAADIFNVFNSAYVTAVNDLYGTPSYEHPISVTDPRSIRLGLRFTF